MSSAAFVVLSLTVARAASGGQAAQLSGPFGHGSAQVWVLRPRSPIRDVVVFGHGWKVAPPSARYLWVGEFRPWLDHLVGRGSAVIFPRYQLGTDDPQDVQRIHDFAEGIRMGYGYLGRPVVPFVAVGYSFGASLAFYYAANATASRLPLPRAVQAIFPAGPIPGGRLPPLAPSVRVLIQVGDADSEAGTSGADAFWRWLAAHPRKHKRYEVVHSTPQLAATHSAPKSAVPAARRAFWAPLDRLIALARTAR